MRQWVRNAWRFLVEAGRVVWDRNSLIGWVLVVFGVTGLGAIGWFFAGETTNEVVRVDGQPVVFVHNVSHWPWALAFGGIGLALLFLVTGVRLVGDQPRSSDANQVALRALDTANRVIDKMGSGGGGSTTVEEQIPKRFERDAVLLHPPEGMASPRRSQQDTGGGD